MGSHMLQFVSQRLKNYIPQERREKGCVWIVFLTGPTFGFQGLPRLPPGDCQDPLLMFWFDLGSIFLNVWMLWGAFLQHGAKIFAALVNTRRGVGIGCRQLDAHMKSNDMSGKLTMLFTIC